MDEQRETEMQSEPPSPGFLGAELGATGECAASFGCNGDGAAGVGGGRGDSSSDLGEPTALTVPEPPLLPKPLLPPMLPGVPRSRGDAEAEVLPLGVPGGVA